MTSWLHAIGEIFRKDRPPRGDLADLRQLAYYAWDAFYDNRIYDLEGEGGQRETINRGLGNGAAADLAGLYNPVARTVDLYEHVLGGSFGTDILVESENTNLVDGLTKIWRWSNINIGKQRLCKYAPLHGNAGIRIIADRARRRVSLGMEHPQVAREVDQDQYGNLRGVLLEYDMEIGPLLKREPIRIRELMTKEKFQTWRLQGGVATPFDLFAMQDGGTWEYENELGVVPYVLLSHTADMPWSPNAFYNVTPQINRLNALITHINIQIHQHVRATWAIAAAGNEPQEFDFSGNKVLYFNTAVKSNETAAPPHIQAMVSNLSLADAIAEAVMLMAIIEDSLPELKATGGKYLSGQSGETIAQLRKPAEDKIARARTNYEGALVRAQQIATSWAVLYGLWDVGTGMGTLQAAEAAYQSGAEDHSFNQRALLPLTEQEKLTLALQKKAIGLSQRAIYTDMGIKDVDGELMEKQKETEAAQAQFAKAFDRGTVPGGIQPGKEKEDPS